MRPRPAPVTRPSTDPDGWPSSAGEITYDLFADTPRVLEAPRGPLSVCLSCGGDPAVRAADCAHDETARFEQADAAVHAAAQRLHALTLDRSQQERTLRKLVSTALADGFASIDRREVPHAFVSAPALTGTAPPLATARPRRRGAVAGTQGTFAFVAPAPSDRFVPPATVPPVGDPRRS